MVEGLVESKIDQIISDICIEKKIPTLEDEQFGSENLQDSDAEDSSQFINP